MLTTTNQNTSPTQLVKEIGNRMKNPDLVKQIVLDPKNRNIDPLNNLTTSYWNDLSIGSGYPGVLLLLAELDRVYPDENWEQSIHSYVLKIKETIENSNRFSLTLFGGLAGCCFALQQASSKGYRYQKILKTLHHFLVERVQQEIFPILRTNIENGLPSDRCYYELIQGISGIGICCLNDSTDSLPKTFIEEILQLLIALTTPIKISGKWVPGWFTPSSFELLDKNKIFFPNGSYNLGLSHGITGVMAFLSISLLKGVNIKGQKEAIETIATWLQERRRKSKESFFWEHQISFENESIQQENSPFSGRDAWCYGTPGVARSLFIAGKALNNQSLQFLAFESYCSIFKRTIEQWHLPGPCICHGIAGLLLITSHMVKDTKDLELSKQTKFLKNKLLTYYNSEFPFGFQDYEPTKNKSFARIDNAGLLEGASGILLTLLSTENETSWWDAPFLIGT